MQEYLEPRIVCYPLGNNPATGTRIIAERGVEHAHTNSLVPSGRAPEAHSGSRHKAPRDAKPRSSVTTVRPAASAKASSHASLQTLGEADPPLTYARNPASTCGGSRKKVTRSSLYN